MSVETTAITPEDLERLSRHLECLDKAAADEAADPSVRARAGAMASAFRVALTMLGAES